MAPGGPIGGSTRKEVSGARSWSPTASRRACTTPSPTRRATRPTQAMSGGSRLHGGPGASGAAAVAAPAAPSNRADDAGRSAVRSPSTWARGSRYPAARAGPGWHGHAVPRPRPGERLRNREADGGAGRIGTADVDRRRHRGGHGGLHEPGAGERRQADRPAQRRILPGGGAVRNAGRRAAVYRTERASDRGSRAQRPAAADPHGAPRASGAPRAGARPRAREVARGPAPHGSGIRRRARGPGSRAPRAHATVPVDRDGVRRGDSRVDRVAWVAGPSTARDGARTGGALSGGGWGPGRPVARLDRRPARRVFHRFRGGRRRRLPAIPRRHASRPALDPSATGSMAGDRHTVVGGLSLLRMAAARWSPADRGRMGGGCPRAARLPVSLG